jgi:ferric-dicitrate binding protein FerR (iron transport regulator)
MARRANHPRFRPRRRSVILGLSVVVAVALAAVGGLTGHLRAQGPARSSAPAGAMQVVPVQLSGTDDGVVVLDPGSQVLCVYRFASGGQRLVLVACRDIGFDLQLQEHNTEPSVRQVRELIEQQRQLQRTMPSR